MRRALLAAAVGMTCACSGARTPVAPPRVDLPVVDTGPAFVTPAHWDYHPAAPTAALSAVKLPDGTCAFTAEGGQRWSAAATKMAGGRLVCTGKAEASIAVAPEELNAIVRLDDAWLFVGESGTLYEASAVLGAFSRTNPAPEPLAKVVGVGGGVLAATSEGRLRRWEAEKGWRPASSSPDIARARIFDLAVGSAGKVLALGFPEALFTSEDGGATWATAPAPHVGARRLGAVNGGDLGAQGIFDSVVWRGGAFVRVGEKIAGNQATLDVDAARAPSASALGSGRAVLDGDRYYEVVRPDSEGDLWLMARGRVEGRLETMPIPGSDRCASMRIGARGKVVYSACVFTDGGEIVAELHRSADAGATWGAPLRLTTPDTDQIVIAVSSEGQALVTGACRTSDGSGSCKPGAPLILREGTAGVDGGAPDGDAGADGGADAADAGAAEGPALVATSTSAPQLSGMPTAPVFGADGRSAYFLGKRGKDDRVTLFASHDGGDTFSPRTLQVVNAPPVRRPDSDDQPSDSDAPETYEIDESSTLRPGEDGAIGLVVNRSRSGAANVVVDDDGRVVQVAVPPVDDEGNAIDVVFGGWGRRLIALPMNQDVGFVWESLDGGANWDKQVMPQALVREYARAGVPAVVCSLAGCLIGETVSRVGWGAPADMSASDRQPDAPPGPGQTVLTPIVCDLAATTKWARVDDVFDPNRNPVPIPAVSDLARGRSVWSALSIDHATGALATTSATLPDSGTGEARVVRRPLIGPAAPHTATGISATQVEGYAVVRVAYPTDAAGKPKIGAPLRNMEVAWENFLEGTSSHARIPDAGPIEREDIVQVPGGVDLLQTGMISISSHGFFVRPHRLSYRGGLEIFVDPAGRVDRYTSTSWPNSTALGQLDFRADAAAIGGEVLGVGLIRSDEGSWPEVVLAKRGASGQWSFTAEEGLLPTPPGASLVALNNWGWSAKAPVGVYSLLVDPQRARAWAYFLGFRPDGTFQPAQPVPTLYDLGERPHGCTAADRAGTPRVVVHLTGSGDRVLFPGARHPVLVQEPRPKNAVGIIEPITLITRGAVVHGTPEAPCLAAFEAEPPPNAVGSASMGAVIPGDLTHAWLFRVASDAPAPPASDGPARRPGRRARAAAGDPPPALEYRPMTCHYDPTARIPESIWNAPGTTRP